MYRILYICILTFSVNAFAQKPDSTIVYLDKLSKVVKKRKAELKVITYNFGDTLWLNNVIDIKNNIILKQTSFADKDLTVLNGYYLENFWNGNTRKQGLVIANKQVGEWLEFYENKDTFKIIHLNSEGKKNGIWKEFYKNGNLNYEVIYKDDLAHGVWKSFYEDQTLQGVELYHNGQKHGIWKHYFENGRVKDSVTYDLGVLHGESCEYHDNGIRKSTKNYNKAKREGIATEWYNNGEIQTISTYSNDSLRERKSFYTTGIVHVVYRIESDYYTGTSTVHDSLGNKIKEIYFSGIMPDSVRCFNEFGDITRPFDPDLDSQAIRENEHLIPPEITDEIFVVVEKMPSYPGGEPALMRFLSQNVRYPTVAQENRKQGRVFVQFVIGKTGEIANITVVRGVYPALNDEAVRVIRLMPKWIPGEQRGKPVNVQFMLPINFVLN